MKRTSIVRSAIGRGALLVLLALLTAGTQSAAAQVQGASGLAARSIGWSDGGENARSDVQSALLDKQARLRVENAALREALSELADQAQVPLVFSPSMLATMRVSCDCESRTVGEALDLILANTGFRYAELAGQILIERGPSRVLSDVSADPRLELPYRGGSLASFSMPAARAAAVAAAPAVRQGTITGTIRDAQTGAPLTGVQVVIEGTTRGGLTNGAGGYTLPEVDAGTHVIVARMIGYREERQTGVQVVTGQTTTVDFLLTQAAIALDAIVAVGYGEQEAANITGSVSRVSEADVDRVPAPTIGQALQGQSPGLFIKNVNAQPGQNKIDINIRGFGDPLFLVDGHEVEPHTFQEIDPSNIEDLVVLKDAAAAAVYGARAGNGVVLVTTKRGTASGAPQFSYSSELSRQVMTFEPDMANSWEHMQFYNLRSDYQGLTPNFTQMQIDSSLAYRDNSNPQYPNTNMFDLVFRDYAPMQQHNLSVRGGTDDVRYFLSGSWMEQRGILASDEIDLDRYNIRSNLDISLTDNLDVGLDLSAVSRQYFGPFYELQGSGAAPFDADQMYFRIYRWKPWWPVEPSTYENGLLRGAIGGSNPNAWNYMWTEHGGHRDFTDQTGTARVNIGYQLPYNFRAQASYSFVRNNYDWEMFKKRLEEHLYDPDTDEYNLVRVPGAMTLLRQRRDIQSSSTINYQLTNTSNFGDHQLTGLLLFEQAFSNFNRMEAWRLNYPVEIPQLFAGPDQDKDNLGYSQESGRQGIVGRVNYAYGGRYSLEFNFRYDGSSAFPENSRWGFFPSVGGAWNISEESFIQNRPALSFIDALRLRASYGRLGYDRAGDWQHLATYSFVDNGRYIYGPTGINAAIRANALPNPNITWENMDLGNIGVNFDLWGGLLSGEFDVFRRTRSAVLGQRVASLPDVVGATLPLENYQRFQNAGWDAMVNHANTIGGVGYRLGLIVSKSREKLLFTDTREYVNAEDERRNNPIGQYTGRVWRMPTDGLFQSQEEIDNWPDIDGRNNATIQPGDLRFVDRNGDGRITAEDSYVVGSDAAPKFSYGVSGGMNWRGLDFYMMWQGAASFGHDLMNTAIYVQPNHFGNNNIGQHHVTDSYVPENRWGIPVNTDATYPCVCTDGSGGTGNRSWAGIGGGPNGRADFWFAEGDYLRLRNVQLGYRIPQSTMSRFGVDQARVYLSGYNLFTFYHLDFIDPEYDTNNTVRDRYSPQADGGGGSYPGNHHPSMGNYTLGVEVSF